MKPTSLLKKQHRQNEKLLRQLQRAKEESQRSELVMQLAGELAVHMTLEEQIYYPAAMQVVGDKTRILVEKAFLEHQGAKMALRRLLQGEEMSFEAKLMVLKDLVEHHVQEEEEMLLPEVDGLMEEAQLKMLGNQLREAQETMMQSDPETLLTQAGVTGESGGRMRTEDGAGARGARSKAGAGSRAQARA